MSPTRWVLPRALSLSLLASMFAVATASAQYLEPTLRSLDLGTGSVARSPRLLGMGGVSLAVPDRDASINLWDFASIPAGLASDDTTSTLDVRPGTSALSSAARLPFGRERQNLAARGTQAQLEGVYRNRESGGVFGLLADVSSLRWDHPYAATVEDRQGLRDPQAMTILGGVFPRILHGHLYWAMHLRFRSESVQDKFRSIVTNAAGEYIGLGGDELDPPTMFTPIKTNLTTSAYGLSTAYSIGASTKFGLGIEHETDNIKVKNDQTLSAYETDETRPWWNGQAALVGGFGRTFQFGVSGKGRLSDSETDWRFSRAFLAGGNALGGRGHLDTRKEKASEFSVRARWAPGRITVAGALYTAANKVNIDPPNPNDPTSFNRFINATYTLLGFGPAYPDSVIQGESRRYAFGWGGGASYRFGRSTLATEVNWLRDVASTRLLGSGPRRVAWNVRAGLEHTLGARMMGRVGYVYHRVDEDDYTAGNEYKGNAASMGLGYAPTGTAWSLQAGYLFEFRNQDFPDPAELHQSRQNLALQIHWAF